MKREIGTFIAGVALAGSVVAGAVALQGDGPTKSAGYSNPVPCVQLAGGELDCGSPVGSPVPLPTVEPVPTATVAPEPTTVIDTIDTLPATGTGASR